MCFSHSQNHWIWIKTRKNYWEIRKNYSKIRKNRRNRMYTSNWQLQSLTSPTTNQPNPSADHKIWFWYISTLLGTNLEYLRKFGKTFEIRKNFWNSEKYIFPNFKSFFSEFQKFFLIFGEIPNLFLKA